MALSNNRLRNCYSAGHGPIPVPVLADAVIYQGALVAIKKGEGLAKPAGVAADLVVLGVAEHAVNATGKANGEEFVMVKPGRWGGFSSAGSTDAITAAQIGDVVYAVDDDTLAKTSNSGARSAAGTFLGFDDRNQLILSVGAGL